jgi:hypothetical protein
VSRLTVGPGIHLGISDDEYRRIRGLSSTGIKRMLSSPAVYDWYRQHPEPPKTEFDLGHAVHNRVLGIGTDEVIVPGEWRTNAAKQAVAEAREAGKTPLKPEQAERADELAKAVLNHPDAALLLAGGQPEVSILWDDPVTGVRCKGRIDYWHEQVPLAVDLKTTRDANPARFARHAADYSYGEQAQHYTDGIQALTGARPRFLHVLVQTEGPPLVTVCDLAEFTDIARENVRTAIEMYRDCTESGVWPGIPHGIHRISPPRWYSAHDTLEYV